MEFLPSIETVLRNHFSVSTLTIEAEAVSGGDIHQSFVLSLIAPDDSQKTNLPTQLFVKLNSNLGKDVLKTEFESLQIINALVSNVYPQALLFETVNSQAMLFMAFHGIEPLNSMNAAAAGHALAQQHKVTEHKFGWPSDNYIGLTKQSNQRVTNWVDFFTEQRLVPMLELASNNGLAKHRVDSVNRVISKLGKILTHQVVPSFVHGDLWSGNIGHDSQTDKPLLYDPAPYYGDREVDIAMTELFGEQPKSFYQAYQAVWPLQVGYEQRRPVYNLYHALNHVVLFGLSYGGLIDSCLDQIDC